MAKRYAWSRFWSDRQAQIRLTGDGYLVDPTSETAAYLQPEVFAFGRLKDVPCAILLGEPGIGKSAEAWLEYERLRTLDDQSAGATSFIDLASYQSEDRFIRDVFDTPQVQSNV